MGVARDLYWSICVELDPIKQLGETQVGSFQCEWIVWPVKTVCELDGMGLAQVKHPDMVEATVYLASEHHWITVSDLVIRHTAGDHYQLTVGGTLDIDLDGQELRGPFSLECEIVLEGIVVVPANFSPEPSNPAEVESMVSPFFSLAGLEEPRFDGFRYVLRPAGC